ncbi:unnamed protein product [Prunus armeniaca]
MKIHEDWCCSVKHIFREQNCVADALAAKSYDFAHGLHVFLEAPAFLSDMLAADDTEKKSNFLLGVSLNS